MTDSPTQYPPSFGWPNVFSPEGTGLAIEDVWPSLYVGADRVDEMRRKVEACDWAARALQRWRNEADVVLAEEPHFVPGRTGGRSDMQYRDRGGHLLFDPTQCQRMWDSLERTWVTPDEQQLAAWRLLQQERIRRLMTSLGFVYRLTGDERCSRWVWRGLRRLVDDNYGRSVRPQRDNPYGVIYGGLYEAQCALQVIQAVELVRGGPGETPETLAAVEAEVLGDIGEALSAWMDKMLVHNMSCWSMAALGQLGRYFGRPEWIDKAFHSDRCGLTMLLTHGVPRDAGGRLDGFWFEGSSFYGIFYALTSLVSLVRQAEDAGVMTDDLRERFEALFDGPLHLSDEQLRLLAVGDRVAPGVLTLTQARHLYEYAAGQVSAERYGPIAAMLYRRCGAARDSLAALAWGPDDLPNPAQPPSRSVVLPAARMVTFRGATDFGPLTCWFHAGEDNRSGQGHHHHDKLSLSIHVGGDIVTSDLGLPSAQDNSWADFLNASFSHNTLMIDERAQGPMQSLAFEADLDAPVPFARSTVVGDRADPARQSLWRVMAVQREDEVTEGLYDGVKLSRTVFFDPPRIVLTDAIAAPVERRCEFVFHACGTMTVQTTAAGGPSPGLPAADGPSLALPPLPTEGSFGLFTGRTSAEPLSAVTVDWRVRSGLWLRLVAAADAPFEATWGTTPANPRRYTRGTILLRSPGPARRYVAALELHAGGPSVRRVELLPDGRVRVQTYAGPDLRYPG